MIITIYNDKTKTIIAELDLTSQDYVAPNKVKQFNGTLEDFKEENPEYEWAEINEIDE